MQSLIRAALVFLLIALCAAVFIYRWNHEAVRVYDAPPIRVGRWK